MLIAFQLTLLTVSDDISQPGTFQHIFLFWLTFFTKAVNHLPLFFAQLTLILSFQLPIASCCDLVHYGSWTGCIWWKGRLLSQPLAWIGILISIHYYQRISTPSSRVWHSPRQMKNAHSPCALMCFSMHATHYASSGTGNARSTIQSSYSSPWCEYWKCRHVLMNLWILY